MQERSMNLPPPQEVPPISDQDFGALFEERNAAVTIAEKEALERLIDIAQRDSGQSRRVADFLLAWWNAGTCGGFDLTNLWAVDASIAEDMATVFRLISRVSKYPDTLGYDAEFKALVRAWRQS
jgi:hypothetical protein